MRIESRNKQTCTCKTLRPVSPGEPWWHCLGVSEERRAHWEWPWLSQDPGERGRNPMPPRRPSHVQQWRRPCPCDSDSLQQQHPQGPPGRPPGGSLCTAPHFWVRPCRHSHEGLVPPHGNLHRPTRGFGSATSTKTLGIHGGGVPLALCLAPLCACWCHLSSPCGGLCGATCHSPLMMMMMMSCLQFSILFYAYTLVTVVRRLGIKNGQIQKKKTRVAWLPTPCNFLEQMTISSRVLRNYIQKPGGSRFHTLSLSKFYELLLQLLIITEWG